MSPSLVSIHAKNYPSDLDHSPPNHSRPSSSRWTTRSFASSSLLPFASFSSSSTVDSPLQTPTPLPSFGIPFSWENQPGIPKYSEFAPCRYKQLLPLPPSAHCRFPKKKSRYSIGSDPFVSALVKCSREGNHWKAGNASRSMFGSMDHFVSCKTTCSVVESTVFIPRSSHGLLSHRAD